jgi:hypothetical protein
MNFTYPDPYPKRPKTLQNLEGDCMVQLDFCLHLSSRFQAGKKKEFNETVVKSIQNYQGSKIS